MLHTKNSYEKLPHMFPIRIKFTQTPGMVILYDYELMLVLLPLLLLKEKKKKTGVKS